MRILNLVEEAMTDKKLQNIKDIEDATLTFRQISTLLKEATGIIIRMTGEVNKDENFKFSIDLMKESLELANRHEIILKNIKERYSTIES